jgi:glyoxylase I family protein
LLGRLIPRLVELPDTRHETYLVGVRGLAAIALVLRGPSDYRLRRREEAVMPFQGVSHVAITVTDLARSKDWYSRVLDWRSMVDTSEEGVDYSVGALPDGTLVGLRQYANGSGDAFTPFRTGLDHLAFAVSSPDQLPEWEQRFAEQGVAYSTTQEGPFGWALNFKDPDGVALEVFAAKPA